MKDRILQFLESEKISPAEFADKIGVQRSSMSHILNGRNHPSAAFIQKMLLTYPLLDSRWLMIGAGTMYTASPGKHENLSSSNAPPPSIDMDANTPFNGDTVTAKGASVSAESTATPFVNRDRSLPFSDFQQEEVASNLLTKSSPGADFSTVQDSAAKQGDGEDRASGQVLHSILSDGKELEQVLFFFTDKTFRVYRPS